MSRYDASLAHLARARAVTPAGAQTLSKRADRFVEGAHPAFIARANGSHVWDLDGHEYVDWIAGLAAVTLGYGYPVVQAAVRRQMEEAAFSPLPTTLEAEVAERLVELIPCAHPDGMVRFVSTGSEATEAAVRIARMATGRWFVIVCGYHGWHSWYAASKPEHPGVPWPFETAIGTFRYNDLDSLDVEIEKELCGANVAAILMEPTLMEPPAPGFLEGVRERATRLGAVLIFDEMVTGFRWSVCGAQSYFGVTPDLATFGKALANGYPIGAVVGRRDLMEHAWVASGTFSGHPVSLAAARAVLDVYKRESIIVRLWDVGTSLRAGVQDVICQTGAPARFLGWPVHPQLVFDDDPDRLCLSLFVQELAARGILWHPAGVNPMAAHTEADVTQTVRSIAEALAVVAGAIQRGTVREQLHGHPISSAFAVRADAGHGGT